LELNFKKYGSGDPLIIIHGLLGMLDNWVGIAKILSEKYSVFIVDLRNHGKSPHNEEFNYKVLSDDLENFIISNDISQPIIIGHSMGGKVCIKLAFHNQKLLKKLVIVDICQKEYPVNKEIMTMFKAMMSIDLTKTYSYHDVESQLDLFNLKEESKQVIIKNLKRDNATFKWKSNIVNIYKNLEYIRSAVISDKKIFVPSLFLRGEKSNFILNSDFQNIYKNFPEAEIITISDAGHWIHSDNKNSFVQAVLDFINQ
jgi:pimeloyl-ACP methyl ester carboxylesterase